MSVEAVRAALIDLWEQANVFKLDDGPLPTAYENVHFDPKGLSAWAQLFFLTGQPSVGSLGEGGEDELTGILQIDLYYPLGEGPARIYRSFDLLRQVFKAGTYSTVGLQWVLINSCGLSSTAPDSAWYKGIVTIEWETRLVRTI